MGNPNLHVRIGEPGKGLNVTPRLVDDLSFSSSAPGGFTACDFTLTGAAADKVRQFSVYQPVDVIDGRTGQAVWSGRLEEPGRDKGTRRFGAVGGQTHAKDQQRQVIYTDTRLGMWQKNEAVVAGNAIDAKFDLDQTGVNGAPASRATFAFGKGMSLPVNGTRVVAQYNALYDTGQYLARLEGSVQAGKTSAGILFEILGRGGPDSLATLLSQTSNASLTGFVVSRVNFAGLRYRVPEMRMAYSGTAPATVGDDLFWVRVQDIRMTATRVDQFGNAIPEANYSADTPGLYPDRVVMDVVGRLLPEVNPYVSTIDITLQQKIDQMAYEDPVDADHILGDVMALNPSHYWAIWERQGGGYRFVWRPWPTVVSMTLDTRLDAFSSPGGASDLYNQVTVRWKDGLDRPHSTLVTGSVPALDAAGLVRRGAMDLGGSIGSAAAATNAGNAFLTAHRYPSNSGTIKVSRPVFDASQGRTVQPWEIRAGILVKVGNLAPQVDYLNASAQNGSTVFQCSGVAYSSKDNTATLTLDSYGDTVAKALAQLTKKVKSARRA